MINLTTEFKNDLKDTIEDVIRKYLWGMEHNAILVYQNGEIKEIKYNLDKTKGELDYDGILVLSFVASDWPDIDEEDYLEHENLKYELPDEERSELIKVGYLYKTSKGRIIKIFFDSIYGKTYFVSNTSLFSYEGKEQLQKAYDIAINTIIKHNHKEIEWFEEASVTNTKKRGVSGTKNLLSEYPGLVKVRYYQNQNNKEDKKRTVEILID